MQHRAKVIWLWFILSGLFSTLAIGAPFREYPIGESIEINQLEIAAVWLPPVKMDHTKNMEDLKKRKNGKVIHLEADIHSTAGNENGFGAGEWVPNLTVSYKISNKDGMVVRGQLFPMVAKDGPHYGAQIFLPFDNYKLIFHIKPPDSKEFGRHTDPITGVAPWWKPFDATWSFNFKGANK